MRSFLIAFVAMLTGCAGVASKSSVVAHDPLLDQNGGVILIVDVCILRDAMGDADDYFLATEAKAGAQELVGASQKYLEDSGVHVRTTLIPFVCGAMRDTKNWPFNPPQRLADHVGGTVIDAKQPFAISHDLKTDPEFVAAITKMATYAFQHATTPKEESKPVNPEPPDQLPLFVSAEEFKEATILFASRTGGSSVLYLGVSGYSQSTGKSAFLNVGRFTFGIVTAIATAGVVAIIPGKDRDSSLMSAAVVNLESSQVTWSNSMRVSGDPVDPAVVGKPGVLQSLLYDLVHKPTPALSDSAMPNTALEPTD